MSDLMRVQCLATTSFEYAILTKIEKGRSMYPRDLRKRAEYYKDLFDRSVNNRNGYMTHQFKSTFSLFVSNTVDSIRCAEAQGML